MADPDSSPGLSDAEVGQPFGAWLKQRRREMDLTQDVLAEQAGCSTEMLRKIEAGARAPVPPTRRTNVARLGIPTSKRPSFIQWARTGLREVQPQDVQIEEQSGNDTSVTSVLNPTRPPVPPFMVQVLGTRITPYGRLQSL